MYFSTLRLASIFLFTADHERSRELDGSFVTSHGFIESRDILNSNRHLLEGKGHQKDHRDTWTTLLACRGSLYLLVGRMRVCLYVYVLLFIAHLHTSTVLKVLPKCFGKAVSGWLGGRALTEPKLPRPELTLHHFWLRHSVPLNYIYFLSTLLSASKEGRLIRCHHQSRLKILRYNFYGWESVARIDGRKWCYVRGHEKG